MTDPPRSGYRRARRWWLAFLAVAFVAIVATHDRRALRRPLPPTAPDQAVLDIFPGAARVERAGEVLWVKDAAGLVVGAAFQSARGSPAVKGYNGEIDALVGLAPDGRIVQVRVLSHEETPYYFSMLGGEQFTTRFEGKTAAEAAGLDAISGATVSSVALRNDVALGAATVAQQAWGIEPSPKVTALGGLPVAPRDLALVLGIIGLTLAAHFGRRRARWLRVPAWVASVAVVGIWLNVPVSVGNLLRLAALDPPRVPALLVLTAFAVVAAPLFGRVYCGYACPFGALQEALHRVPTRKWRATGDVALALADLRYLLVVALAALVLLKGWRAFGSFEPYATLFSLSGGAPVWVYAGLALAGSAFVKRFWCRFLCPTGACLDALSALRRTREYRFDDEEG